MQVEESAHLYEVVAAELARHIEGGLYRPGERLPGVRAFGKRRGVSIATAVAAYQRLEDLGYLEARPRSGYYVRGRLCRPLSEKLPTSLPRQPRVISGQDMAMALIKAANDPAVVQLGAAVPDASYLPMEALSRAMTRTLRLQRVRAASYMMAPGAEELRRQIARRLVESGGKVSADDIVITTGCQESLALALRAVTQPGDIVAVESPTFYGLLHVMDALGLKVLEIPSHPREGMALETLEQALRRWPIKACVAIPNVSNPLGFCMSDERKRALIALLEQHRVTLIEDEVYGDLSFQMQRPASCLSLAPKGDIIQCGSFSKTLSPGLRVGWAASSRHRDRIEYLKYVTSIASSTTPQLVVADFLESGRYERYLRTVRGRYTAAVARMSDALLRHFPDGTRLSQPQGGFLLWVELPADVDAFALAQRALKKGVSIAPGPIFSASGRYGNFIRVSCARQWDARLERALVTLANLLSG